jgi:phosphatidylinositol 3-kinase
MADLTQPATHTATFGLAKDLAVPVTVTVGHLEARDAAAAAAAARRLHTASQKYQHPQVFKRLSATSATLELYVTAQLFDAAGNALAAALQTPHRPHAGRRAWQHPLQMAPQYRHVGVDTRVRLAVWEVVETRAALFGAGEVLLYEGGVLRQGAAGVPIAAAGVTGPGDGDAGGTADTTSAASAAPDKLLLYHNRQFERVDWLDELAVPLAEQRRAARRLPGTADAAGRGGPAAAAEAAYLLYVEFPRFALPVIYADVTYSTAAAAAAATAAAASAPPVDAADTLINSIDIAPAGVFDPDYQHADPPPDPVEVKCHRLERNVNNNLLVDRQLKPSPSVRDELMRILRKPSNVELSDAEKNLVWKYRYYFSKSGGDEQAPRLFFTKFLKLINWLNDAELDHVFGDLIPTYWTVEKIQVGDAMELLGSYFNPYVLAGGAPARAAAGAAGAEAAAGAAGAGAAAGVTTAAAAAAAATGSSAAGDRFARISHHVAFLRSFAVDRLRLAPSDELLLYLLQLVQALKYESSDAPLAAFLVTRAIANDTLGNFFYWYVKVENEDQLRGPRPLAIYATTLNQYIDGLRRHCETQRTRGYAHLKRQIWFVKKLTTLVELLRATFRKNEATARKGQFLRDYLADPAHELLEFPEPFPLPLDPSVVICGCYPQELAVFKSSLAPLKITFKTTRGARYALMFKIGDDLRQDQLVIQIIGLMDQLLKNENLDLRLTPYKILATSPVAGLIQFVPNETLDSVLANYGDPPAAGGGGGGPANGILNYLRLHGQTEGAAAPTAQPANTEPAQPANAEPAQPADAPAAAGAVSASLGVPPPIMDNYIKSCAGYCVITYLLGVGDRHLDNLLLLPDGKFWHADFGYILGRDPKPFPPLMKLPIQVVDGMGGLGHENFSVFRNYCFITYTTLRKNSNLILNLFLLMLDANIPDIRLDPQRAVEKVEEKFCLEMSEEEAILHFQNLITDSVNAFLPVVIDRLHSLAQYWRA